MALLLKKLLFGLISKSILNKRRGWAGALLGICAELPLFSSTNLFPARALKWPHQTQARSWIHSLAWELSPQAVKLGRGELLHFAFNLHKHNPGWNQLYTSQILLVKPAIYIPASCFLGLGRNRNATMAGARKVLDIILKFQFLIQLKNHQ